MNSYRLPKRQARQQPQQHQPVERAWNTADVAAYLGRCPKTVRTLARSGVIPAKRVNRTYLFDADKIREWVRQDETHFSLAP